MAYEELIDLDSLYNEGQQNVTVVNQKSINNQILNLFSIQAENGSNSTGDRIFEPTYGASLEKFLFDPFDDITASKIKDYIYTQICNWLPFIFVTRDSISVIADDSIGAYSISIQYIYGNGNLNSVKFALKK